MMRHHSIMNSIWICLFILLVSITLGSGTRCFTCSSQNDNDDCNWKGGLKECGDEICMNAIRFKNGKYLVSKGCAKQDLCENLERKNPCDSNNKKLCYDCCGSDGCNYKLSKMEETTEEDNSTQLSTVYFPSNGQSCESLPDIEDGNITCTGRAMGSVCLASCEPEYVLNHYSSIIRTCSFSSTRGYFWSGENASCIKGKKTCTAPNLNFAKIDLIQLSPHGVVYQVAISDQAKSRFGWTVGVELKSALSNDEIVETYDAVLGDISEDKSVLVFYNSEHNKDLTKLQNKNFMFVIKRKLGIEISEKFFNLKVGFIGYSPCKVDFPGPVTTTIAATTKDTGLTTISPPPTTTAPAPATAKDQTVQDEQSYPDPNHCTVGLFKLSKEGYSGKSGDKWFFAFKIILPKGDYVDWTMRVKFNKDIFKIVTFNFVGEKSEKDRMMWSFHPHPKNKVIENKHFVGVGIATVAQSLKEDDGVLPNGEAMVCSNFAKPPVNNAGPDELEDIIFTPTKKLEVAERCKSTMPAGILPERSGFTDATQYKQSADGEKYDYNELIHKSLLFYEAQRSGYLPDNNRIPWRGDSGLKDGCDVGVDLTGGYHDAGDHVKFGFPMAATIAVISWSVIEFNEAYVDVQEYRNALEMIKWGTDYFIKAHTAPTELWVQVGQGNVDHSYWGHPETMDMKRVSMKVDEENPGTEVAAETAAALAAASIVFKNINEEYSSTCLRHAVQLFNFADKFRKNYHLTITDATTFYKSWSGYDDELAWAAAWLFKATRQRNYLSYAAKLIDRLSMHEFSWDGKGPGVLALLAQEQQSYIPRLKNAVQSFSRIQKTPAGMTWLLEWGPNRYTANYAFISLVTAKLLHDDDSSDYKFFHDYAEEQIHCMLGSGDNERSYVVGFGVNPPQKPHHRAASCSLWRSRSHAQCTYNDLTKKTANQLTLYGALVGGPSLSGHYKDNREDYKLNEVAMDYNSGYQSALAGLKYFVIKNRNE